MLKRLTMFKSPLRLKTLILLVALWFFGWEQIIPEIMRSIVSILGENFSWTNQFATLVLNLGVFIITGIIAILIIASDNIKHLNPKRELINWKLLGLLLAAYFTWNIIASVILENVLPPTVGDSQNQTGIETMASLYPLGVFFLTVVLAPIVEELIYRVGLSGLISKFNVWVAIFVSSFIFGFAHIYYAISIGETHEWWYMLSYMGSGIIFAFAYHKTNSPFYPWALHFTNNLLASLPLLFILK